jgi:hypothetical protein
MLNIIITKLMQILEAIKAIKITKISKEIKTCACISCKTDISLETAIPCDLCGNDYDEDKISPLFCKKCTRWCDACEEVQGCKECVIFTCCDCGYYMCYECRNNEVDCGCYGECYSCGVDVNRGSEGWPCGECEKWYCHYCRESDNNQCKECGHQE